MDKKKTRRPVEDIIQDRIDWLRAKLVEIKKDRLLEGSEKAGVSLDNIAADAETALKDLKAIEKYIFPESTTSSYLLDAARKEKGGDV